MEFYLIAYDISNNKARHQVISILKQHGKRIQKSVFILNMTKNQMEKLKVEISNILSDKDSLLILPCCEHCFNLAEFARPELDNIII